MPTPTCFFIYRSLFNFSRSSQQAAAGISESDILSGKEQNNGFHSSFQESTVSIKTVDFPLKVQHRLIYFFYYQTAVGSSEMDVANSVTNEEHSYLHNSFQLIRVSNDNIISFLKYIFPQITSLFLTSRMQLGFQRWIL